MGPFGHDSPVALRRHRVINGHNVDQHDRDRQEQHPIQHVGIPAKQLSKDPAGNSQETSLRRVASATDRFPPGGSPAANDAALNCFCVR
jgi:hypothetical protein